MKRTKLILISLLCTVMLLITVPLCISAQEIQTTDSENEALQEYTYIAYDTVYVDDSANDFTEYLTADFSPEILYAGNVSTFAQVENSVEFYGRSALANMPNSKVLLYAYDQLVQGVAYGASDISVYDGVNPISKEEIKTILDVFFRDHTEYFWTGNGYSYRFNSTTVLSVTPTYTMTGKDIDIAKAAFDLKADEILYGITPSMSEYEREKLIHDRLAAVVVYDGSGANAHNAYGALVQGRAVCEGYAKAFQCLLHKAGIQSFIIRGASINQSTGASVGHAWNAVRIDGNYYHADLTWDDQGEKIFYAYFNKTTASISEDHLITAVEYELPICDSDIADYFTVNSGFFSEFDLNRVIDLLKWGGGTARFYVTGDKDSFVSVLKENVRYISSQLGLSGYRYSYSSLGRELIYTFSNYGHTHTWSTEWTSDGTTHWHKCLTCDMKKGREVHVFGTVTDETATHLCLVCSYKMNGFCEENGKLYYYTDGNIASGWFTVDGITYYADQKTNVVSPEGKNAVILTKQYLWNSEKGLVLANGFYENAGTNKYASLDTSNGKAVIVTVSTNGTICFENGYLVYGWRHVDGSSVSVVDGVYEQYSTNPQNLYYFLSSTYTMVTSDSYVLGGWTREFNADHTVKPLNGLQNRYGEVYYYVAGTMQDGWQTIDGNTYYFYKGTGKAATKWMIIGEKVYYFYAGSSATPYALKTSGTIGGINYTYTADGSITTTGFYNAEYANKANNNSATYIQHKDATTMYYENGVRVEGWAQIGGNWYYFYKGTGLMCTESRMIGGVWYEFTADGICTSK